MFLSTEQMFLSFAFEAYFDRFGSNFGLVEHLSDEVGLLQIDDFAFAAEMSEVVRFVYFRVNFVSTALCFVRKCHMAKA